MDRTLARRLAVALLIVTAAFVAAPSCEPPAAPAIAAAPSAFVADAPLAFVSADELPPKAPESWEYMADERAPPYHALIRVLSFPDLAPLDVEIGRLIVRGATSARRVAAGEFLFEGIPVGVTAALLHERVPPGDDPLAPAGVASAPGARTENPVLAERNPLPLARHAITTCELLVPPMDPLAAGVEIRGRVFDRVTAAPLAGATVEVGAVTATSDADGRFTLPGTVAWREFFEQGLVGCTGYSSFRPTLRSLSLPWARHLHDEGDVVFTLLPAGEEARSTRLPRLGH